MMKKILGVIVLALSFGLVSVNYGFSEYTSQYDDCVKNCEEEGFDSVYCAEACSHLKDDDPVGDIVIK